MIKYFLIGGLVVVAVVGGWLLRGVLPSPTALETQATTTDETFGAPQTAGGSSTTGASGGTPGTSGTVPSGSGVGGKQYTYLELLDMAGNAFASGAVPLGDNKYVTSGPKKGYVYLCSARKEAGGAGGAKPWIYGNTWNFLQKVSVSGNVSWPTASFSSVVSGANRVLSGNGLPVSHTTGVFPIAKTDKAYAYDTNPNAIAAQTFKVTLPVSPAYSATPYCVGGEVGVMNTGIPIFNAFDAALRDAPAYEVQDSCGGHPQKDGQYHYHNFSSCIKGMSVQSVIGYAFDGFPITGPQVAEGKLLSTEDLDVCHGITSEVRIGNELKMIYHYVMTQDFPYSVSCFRGKPATRGPTASPVVQSGPPPPPQEAVDICAGKGEGASCSFGYTNGICTTIADKYFACKPN